MQCVAMPCFYEKSYKGIRILGLQENPLTRKSPHYQEGQIIVLFFKKRHSTPKTKEVLFLETTSNSLFQI